MMLEDLYRLLRSGHVQAQGVVDTVTQPLVVLDQSLSVITANNAFIRAFEVNRDDILSENFFTLGSVAELGQRYAVARCQTEVHRIHDQFVERHADIKYCIGV